MIDDDEFYHLKVTMDVKLRKFRLDTIENSRWCLMVFDESTKQWEPTGALDRTGEKATVDPIIRIK
jgi:hypothetical protein